MEAHTVAGLVGPVVAEVGPVAVLVRADDQARLGDTAVGDPQPKQAVRGGFGRHGDFEAVVAVPEAERLVVGGDGEVVEI